MVFGKSIMLWMNCRPGDMDGDHFRTKDFGVGDY